MSWTLARVIYLFFSSYLSFTYAYVINLRNDYYVIKLIEANASDCLMDDTFEYYVIAYYFTDRPLASHSYSHGAWSWCSVYSVMSKRNYDVFIVSLLRNFNDSYVQTFLIYDPTLSRISNYFTHSIPNISWRTPPELPLE